MIPPDLLIFTMEIVSLLDNLVVAKLLESFLGSELILFVEPFINVLLLSCNLILQRDQWVVLERITDIAACFVARFLEYSLLQFSIRLTKLFLDQLGLIWSRSCSFTQESIGSRLILDSVEAIVQFFELFLFLFISTLPTRFLKPTFTLL